MKDVQFVPSTSVLKSIQGKKALVACTSYRPSHCNCSEALSDTTCQKLAKFGAPLGSGALKKGMLSKA